MIFLQQDLKEIKFSFKKPFFSFHLLENLTKTHNISLVTNPQSSFSCLLFVLKLFLDQKHTKNQQ